MAYTPDKKEEQDNIVLYIKKTKNASYPTKYGLEFQCVELIRRFFTIRRRSHYKRTHSHTNILRHIIYDQGVSYFGNTRNRIIRMVMLP